MNKKLAKINFGKILKLLFLPLPAICLFVHSFFLIGGLAYYSHSSSGSSMMLLWCVPIISACIVLMMSFRILLKNRAMSIIAIIAAAILAHHMYAATAYFKQTKNTFFLIFCICAVCGLAALALYIRRTGTRRLKVTLAMIIPVVCFVFGSGNPQWSRYIFIYQVYYSPWKREAVNLPTNRHDPRGTYPTYTEWDKSGRRILQWSHPDGVLLRTTYYPDGSVREKRLYDVEQFVTHWYPIGRMHFEYNKDTRQKRFWNEDGSVCEGQVTEYFENSSKIRSIQNFKNGFWCGEQRWYDASGTMTKEAEYVDGRRHGIYKEWYGNGQPRSEMQYVDDLAEGTAKYWNRDGKLEREKHYTRGMENQPK